MADTTGPVPADKEQWGVATRAYAAAHDVDPHEVDITDGGYTDVAHILAEDYHEMVDALVEAAGLPEETDFADVLEWMRSLAGRTVVERPAPATGITDEMVREVALRINPIVSVVELQGHTAIHTLRGVVERDGWESAEARPEVRRILAEVRAGLHAALAGRTVVELPEPANGYRYGRAWRRTDAEPPADVTLLRNSAHPGTFDADMPGPYVKRTPSGDWWFVARPDEDTDPEGWPWAGLFDQQDDIWFEVVAAESSGDGESR